jgi:acyl dehydratase
VTTEQQTALESPRELLDLVGKTVGRSPWRLVDQQLVDEFGRITGDEQWIHVDPKAAAEGPFGGTIAHGYLTLSLCSVMVGEAISISGSELVINYGLNRVRFPAPTRVGSRVRARVEVQDASELPGGIQGVFHVEIEREGEEKPACAADLVFRYVLPGAVDQG